MPTLIPENPDPAKLKPSHVITSSDGTRLYLWKWLPTTETPASAPPILIMHGLTAYCRPYEVIANPLADLGFTVYGMDLRGHGLSGGRRGDLKNLDQFIDDMTAVMQFLGSKHENVILLGHSLGVITSLLTVEHFPSQVAGLVLLSGARTLRPGAYPRRSIWTTLKILLSSLLRPSHQVIHYYRDGIEGLSDPQFNFYYTLRFLRTLSEKNITIPKDINYPLFFGVGDQDELFAEESVKELMDEFDGEDKTFAVFPDTFHSRFNDHSFDKLFEWFNTKYC